MGEARRRFGGGERPASVSPGTGQPHLTVLGCLHPDLRAGPPSGHRAVRAGPGRAGEPGLVGAWRRQGPSQAWCLLQVILACNSGPALNDVTYSESLIVTERIAAMDPVVQ